MGETVVQRMGKMRGRLGAVELPSHEVRVTVCAGVGFTSNRAMTVYYQPKLVPNNIGQAFYRRVDENF
jgi:hypothetical protein